ncbi:MAG: putative Se/S carrier-like protein [Eubacterium sp.]
MYYKIKVGSVTNAQRGARILRANGFRPTVSRIENPSANDGCGFVINVFGDIDKALELLKKQGVRILEVYDG